MAVVAGDQSLHVAGAAVQGPVYIMVGVVRRVRMAIFTRRIDGARLVLRGVARAVPHHIGQGVAVHATHPGVALHIAETGWGLRRLPAVTAGTRLPLTHAVIHLGVEDRVLRVVELAQPPVMLGEWQFLPANWE